MGPRTVRFLIVFSLALFVALSIGLFWLAETETAVYAVVVNGVAAAVGAVILLRADQKVIGALLLVLALSWQLGPLVEALLDAGYSSAWLEPLYAFSWMSLGAALILILIFPQGSFPTRSWRVVGWVFVAASIAIGVQAAQLGVSTVDEFATPIIIAAGMMLIAVGMQVFWYRRRIRVEQKQIAWFLFAIGIAATLYIAAAVAGVSDRGFIMVDAVASTIWPLSILIAITRYRLYEIDRIFSRTVTYGFLVALVGGVFLVAVTLTTALIPTQDSLAVAIATLAAAAVFNPLRVRVQRRVDRRFNRRRYESQSVIDTFAANLHEYTTSDALLHDLEGVVVETMSPSVIGTWERR